VTLQSGIESWTTPMYHLDSPDPALIDNIIGIIAYGDRNPRRRAGTVAWGNSVFLGLNPYFLRQEDARWFFRKMLLEVCGEGYLP
jgi:hypothetical protein